MPILAPRRNDGPSAADECPSDDRIARGAPASRSNVPADRHDPTGRLAGRRELRWALTGGAVAAGGVFGVTALVGSVNGFEARRMLEGLKSTAAFAASTYIATGATILALTATMIVFSITHDSEFRRSHYRRIRNIASTTTALIMVAIALMTCLGIPTADPEAPDSGYVLLYWVVLVLGALGGGLTVIIVLMLNYAVRGLIDLGLEGTSYLVVDDGPGALDEGAGPSGAARVMAGPRD